MSVGRWRNRACSAASASTPSEATTASVPTAAPDLCVNSVSLAVLANIQSERNQRHTTQFSLRIGPNDIVRHDVTNPPLLDITSFQMVFSVQQLRCSLINQYVALFPEARNSFFYVLRKSSLKF